MKTRKSEIDKGYEINEDKWLLTLARKTTGTHQQHAFFILEGIENGKAVIWFMDLVGTPILPNLKNGGIRILDFIATSEDELNQSPLLYRCSAINPETEKMYAKMMDLRPNDTIVMANNRPWPINKENALRLIDTIKQDKEKPPVFNIFGETSALTGSSAYLSSKARGHNCFTYAKEKITNLDVPSIKLECDKTAYCMAHIADLTSFTLRRPQSKGNSCASFWKPVIILGAVAAGMVVDQARRYYYSP